MANTVIVMNQAPGIRTLPPLKNLPKSAELKRTVWALKSKPLTPGKNVLNLEYWQTVCKHDGVQEWIALGILRELAPDESVPSKDDPVKQLPTMTQSQALLLIKGTHDHLVLDAAIKDPRPQVVTAAEKRIKKLTETPK